jgi:hypothetical protein
MQSGTSAERKTAMKKMIIQEQVKLGMQVFRVRTWIDGKLIDQRCFLSAAAAITFMKRELNKNK